MDVKQFVNNKSLGLEGYIKNSIPVSALLQNEIDGLGDTTISELLNTLQDLHESEGRENFEVLSGRKRR